MITIKQLFSFNQFFDVFVFVFYLKPLVKVMTVFINLTQGKESRKEQKLARISEVKDRTNKYSWLAIVIAS